MHFWPLGCKSMGTFCVSYPTILRVFFLLFNMVNAFSDKLNTRSELPFKRNFMPKVICYDRKFTHLDVFTSKQNVPMQECSYLSLVYLATQICRTQKRNENITLNYAYYCCDNNNCISLLSHPSTQKLQHHCIYRKFAILYL